MSNWKYANVKGLNAGNTGTGTLYLFVDAINGDDTNLGNVDSAFKTLTKALSVALNSTVITLASGEYFEGDFPIRPSVCSLIAEGTVIFNGTSFSEFRPTSSGSINLNAESTSIGYDFGKFIFTNYISLLIQSGKASDCEFFNINKVSGIISYDFENFKFVRSIFDYEERNNTTYKNFSFLDNSTFINNSTTGNPIRKVLNCYSDSTSTIDLNDGLGTATFNLIDFNKFEGVVKYNGVTYDTSLDEWRTLAPAPHAENDLDPNVAVAFNNVTGDSNEDISVADGDPLSFSSSVGGHIGYLSRGKSLDGNIGSPLLSPELTLDPVTGHLTLTSGTVGTATWTGIQVSTTKAVLTKIELWGTISLPDGEAIDSNLAGASIPNLFNIEMGYSLDNITYTPYQFYPYGVQPKIDGAGVSNGDPLYDNSTATEIEATHVNIRVTLRNDEIKS